MLISRATIDHSCCIIILVQYIYRYSIKVTSTFVYRFGASAIAGDVVYGLMVEPCRPFFSLIMHYEKKINGLVHELYRLASYVSSLSPYEFVMIQRK